MGAIKHIQKTFQKEFKGTKDESYDYKSIQQTRLIEFRKEPLAVVRIEKPTNIARARTLGYKAKKGVIVARIRIRKGSGMHTRPRAGRRPKRMGTVKLTRKISIRSIAERRVSEKFPSLEVLSSYYIGMDGQNQYYEVILANPHAPEIKSDKDLNWICEKTQTGRTSRGMTSAGKKGRGMRKKGKGAEKVRPSQRANKRRTK
ncbi:MAG: 50S ribosomal protein L15e [Candidatus Diapherotrites archaeon]